MTDTDLFGGVVSWRRIPALCRAHQVMLIDGKPNGWVIKAAQHPTALRPYYIVKPNGVALLDRSYSTLVGAKAVVMQHINGENS